jgi:hypothetical protein
MTLDLYISVGMNTLIRHFDRERTYAADMVFLGRLDGSAGAAGGRSSRFCLCRFLLHRFLFRFSFHWHTGKFCDEV